MVFSFILESYWIIILKTNFWYFKKVLIRSVFNKDFQIFSKSSMQWVALYWSEWVNECCQKNYVMQNWESAIIYLFTDIAAFLLIWLHIILSALHITRFVYSNHTTVPENKITWPMLLIYTVHVKWVSGLSIEC